MQLPSSGRRRANTYKRSHPTCYHRRVTSLRTPHDTRVAPWQSFLGYGVGLVITGGAAVLEALRVGSARHTVPAGWGAGLVWGAGVALAVPALFVAAVWALHRRRQRDDLAAGKFNAIALIVGILVEAVLVIVAYSSSTGPKHSPPGHHYVTVSAFGVACMAYVGTTAAMLAVLVLAAPWMGRKRRPR